MSFVVRYIQDNSMEILMEPTQKNDDDLHIEELIIHHLNTKENLRKPIILGEVLQRKLRS